PARFDQAWIGLQLRVESQRSDNHPATLEAHNHGFVETLMQRFVEVLGFQKRRGAFNSLIVDKYRTKQRLFDVDVVWDVAIKFFFHAVRALKGTRINRAMTGSASLKWRCSQV